MALSGISLAEEALALLPEERAELARLLVGSLREDNRCDEEIKADLHRRLDDLQSGKDQGASFEQVFGPTA